MLCMCCTECARSHSLVPIASYICNCMRSPMVMTQGAYAGPIFGLRLLAGLSRQSNAAPPSRSLRILAQAVCINISSRRLST